MLAMINKGRNFFQYNSGDLVCFFYESHEVLVLPPQYTEIYQCSGVISSVKMIIYWERGFQMFLEPLL